MAHPKGSAKGKTKSSSSPDDKESLLQQTLGLLQDTVDSLNSTVSSLNNTVKTLEQSVHAQKIVIERLEAHVLEQEKQIAELKNQHKRHDRIKMLKFHGLTCNSSDGKEEVIQCIKQYMNVQISSFDIATRILQPKTIVTPNTASAHFPQLNRQGSEETIQPYPVTVLVSFQNIWQRKQVYFNKKTLKNTRIFVSEDLSKEDAHLFYLCRKLRKDGKIKATWTKELNIFIKTMADEVVTVKGESDLSDFCQPPSDQTVKEKRVTSDQREQVMKDTSARLPPRSTPITRSKAAAKKTQVTVHASSSSSSNKEDGTNRDSDKEDKGEGTSKSQ